MIYFYVKFHIPSWKSLLIMQTQQKVKYSVHAATMFLFYAL
jgi:hypothetical protein